MKIQPRRTFNCETGEAVTGQRPQTDMYQQNDPYWMHAEFCECSINVIIKMCVHASYYSIIQKIPQTTRFV